MKLGVEFRPLFQKFSSFTSQRRSIVLEAGFDAKHPRGKGLMVFQVGGQWYKARNFEKQRELR
jgi:hypothetical protein